MFLIMNKRTKYYMSRCCILFGFSLFFSMARAEVLELPEGQISLESQKGAAYLTESIKQDYLTIEDFFETQSHGAYCGVASSVAVINALSGDKTIDQETYFKPEVKSSQRVKKSGMSLQQLTNHFVIHGMKTKMINGNELTLEQFRQLAIANFKNTKNFLVINYYRKTLNQVGGGHISPVVAYHQASDSMLVMDTATYKYPPTWIKTEDLLRAINTQSWDDEHRGIVEVEKSKIIF